MDVRNINHRKLIGIEYPGRVENVDKMINTLGGIEELSRDFQEKQKIQLKFRPNNLFSKPTFGDNVEATGIVLKVKIRKSKKDPARKPEFVSTELVGTVGTMYKFNNLCDYQYLPIQKNEKTGKTELFYNDVVPNDITSGPSWFKYDL